MVTTPAGIKELTRRATSTFALTNSTMPYVLKLAENGWRTACQ